MPTKNKKPFTNIALLVSAVILIAAVLMPAAILHTKYFSPEVASHQESTFLYVQTAHSGSLTPLDNGKEWVLTLNNVSPVTVYFAERPDRETGHESTEELIAEWNQEGEDSFADNPPNAALDIIGDDSQSIAIVELMSAKYNSATQTLEYEVIILDDETGGNIPQSFGNAALFIDSTHKDYHCGCRPPSGEKGKTCKCEYEYTLGKSATKEFRAYCDKTSMAPNEIGISERHGSTSCTTNFPWDHYVSRSCTNWSFTTRDKVKVTVHCQQTK